jgi:hypothetical protein
MSDADAVPERRIWTEADFEQMGWHDCAVHALAFRPERFELRLDLDYILRWIAPTEPGGPFTFRLAPATLVFHNVSEATVDLQPWTGALPTLDALTRADPQPTPNGRLVTWSWELDGHEGAIRLRATGYTQALRAAPRVAPEQRLTWEERGGPSFALPGDET